MHGRNDTGAEPVQQPLGQVTLRVWMQRSSQMLHVPTVHAELGVEPEHDWLSAGMSVGHQPSSTAPPEGSSQVTFRVSVPESPWHVAEHDDQLPTSQAHADVSRQACTFGGC